MLEEDLESMDQILNYYKNWDSSTTPVMLVLDNSNNFTENIENVDRKNLGYLRMKYGKS
ncbi:hypothetical protein LCGC14_1077840 [marine sediment metagenome]|uniref:Uncharacterized protein n=1 Tax=marine sediment metagenome TaxID=412755 RepID=A0A0F9PZE3_9ZZZZ